MAKSEHIHIVGESPLVEEYSTLCRSRGYAVAVRFNPGSSGTLQRGVKKATTALKTTATALELTNTSPDIKKKNLIALDKALPAHVPIISSSLTVTVVEQSTWIKQPARLIGVGALPSLLDGSLIEFAASHATNKQTLTKATEFASSLGKESAVVQDSIGLVMPRILCMLVNEAYFAMMEGVATAADIDTAMKLGTNYPHGPVEWAEKIRLKHVHAVLSALHKHFGEDRYRIAPLLQHTALRN